jgi:hypothetical protein
MQSDKQITAEIGMPYFKQGDDLSLCIVKDADGSVNVKETLTKYQEFLQRSVDIIEALNKEIPDDNDASIDGNTHCIWITGNERLIKNLVDKDFAHIHSYEEESSSAEGNYDELDPDSTICSLESDSEENKESNSSQPDITI